MIADNISNSRLYNGMHKGFEQAFEFIKSYNKSPLPVGRYEIDGTNVYALVQEYETKPFKEKKWEAHKNYIDIQYIVSGKEIIHWTNIGNLEESTEYNAEKDIIFYSGDEWTSIKMEAGTFSILYPKDAHTPGCVWDETAEVKKIVLKIRME